MQHARPRWGTISPARCAGREHILSSADTSAPHLDKIHDPFFLHARLCPSYILSFLQPWHTRYKLASSDHSNARDPVRTRAAGCMQPGLHRQDAPSIRGTARFDMSSRVALYVLIIGMGLPLGDPFSPPPSGASCLCGTAFLSLEGAAPFA